MQFLLNCLRDFDSTVLESPCLSVCPSIIYWVSSNFNMIFIIQTPNKEIDKLCWITFTGYLISNYKFAILVYIYLAHVRIHACIKIMIFVPSFQKLESVLRDGGSVSQIIAVSLTGKDVMVVTTVEIILMRRRRTVLPVTQREISNVKIKNVFPKDGAVILTMIVMTVAMKIERCVVSNLLINLFCQKFFNVS